MICKHGLLIFSDIKVKEPTLESMCKKKKEYMPPMFMTVSQAASQLLQICSSKKDSGSTDLRKLQSLLLDEDLEKLI